MKKNVNLFGISNEIIELNPAYEKEAKTLALNLRNDAGGKNYFIEIECFPNGKLNQFHYGNGLESAKKILNIGGSFIGEEQAWLAQKIGVSEQKPFYLDYLIGEKLGLWERIRQNNCHELLDWSKPFCVKNAKGLTKIWHPELRKLYRTGFATRSSIIRFIREETAYLQAFYQPLQAINSISWKMNYHLVFFYHEEAEPEFIGGIWVSRPGYKIYPDKDSIIGLISPQKV